MLKPWTCKVSHIIRCHIKPLSKKQPQTICQGCTKWGARSSIMKLFRCYPIVHKHFLGDLFWIKKENRWKVDSSDLKTIWFQLNSGFITWGRGWMTKASGVGEKEGKRWVAEGLSPSCRGIVRPNEDATMIHYIWYMIYDILITMIYMGAGQGEGRVMSLGSPGILAQGRRL